MSASATSAPRRFAFSPRRLRDRVGDAVLYLLAAAAALLVLVTVGLLAYELVKQSWLAISEFGLDFVTSRAWDPVKSDFGALDFIFGTVYTSFLAVVVAAPRQSRSLSS